MAPPILIVGSSHLAFRLGKKLRTRSIPFAHVPSERFVEDTLEKSDLEHAKEVLDASGAALAPTVCLLEDSDSRNINLLLATLAITTRGRIFVTITNENLVAHIAASHPSVHVFNPHAIASATFADAVRCADPRRCDRDPREERTTADDGTLLHIDQRLLARGRVDRIVRNILILLLAAIAGGVLFFRWTEGTSWVQSFYLVATIISGLNFEDAVVHNYTASMVTARAILILTAQVLTLIAFSLIVDYIIKRRTETLEFGRKRYSLRNHIIVCGLGRTGFHVAMELLRRGEKIIALEPNPNNLFLHVVRSAGAKVLIGDASLAKNLMDADVLHAAGLVSTISEDIRNLEIGLNARSLRKDIRLVLRIFDKEIAEEMKTRFNIHFAYSTSSLAAQHLVSLLTEKG